MWVGERDGLNPQNKFGDSPVHITLQPAMSGGSQHAKGAHSQPHWRAQGSGVGSSPHPPGSPAAHRALPQTRSDAQTLQDVRSGLNPVYSK